jgi:DNA replication and repair protein RecF
VARSAEQTLITAAVLEDVPAELRGARVEVGGGAVHVLDDPVPGDPVPDDTVLDELTEGRVP